MGFRQLRSIRELIFELKRRELINSDHQLALFFAARKILVDHLIRPGREKGITYLSDRSYSSTGAYQGYGEGRRVYLIENMSKVVMKGCRPDGIVFLDISASTASSRTMKDDGPFDEPGIKFQGRVIAGYREMAGNSWSGVPWYVVDAEQPFEKVAADV